MSCPKGSASQSMTAAAAAAAGKGDEFGSGSSAEDCSLILRGVPRVVVCTLGDHNFTSLDTLLKRGGTKNKNVLGRGGFTHLREMGNIKC